MITRRRLARARSCRDLPRGLDAVHARHLPVHEHEVVRACPLRRRSHGIASACVAAERPRRPRDRQSAQQRRQDLARRGVVVDHQHAQAAAAPRRGTLRPRLGRRRPEAGREAEGAALARLALDPDLPAHQLDQALARSSGRGRCRRTCAWSSMSACVNGWNSLAACSGRHADAGVAHRRSAAAPCRRLRSSQRRRQPRPRPAR